MSVPGGALGAGGEGERVREETLAQGHFIDHEVALLIFLMAIAIFYVGGRGVYVFSYALPKKGHKKPPACPTTKRSNRTTNKAPTLPPQGIRSAGGTFFPRPLCFHDPSFDRSVNGVVAYSSFSLLSKPVGYLFGGPLLFHQQPGNRFPQLPLSQKQWSAAFFPALLYPGLCL